MDHTLRWQPSLRQCWGAKALSSQRRNCASQLHAEKALCPEGGQMLTWAAVPLEACLLAIESLQTLLHSTHRAVFPVLCLCRCACWPFQL